MQIVLPWLLCTAPSPHSLAFLLNSSSSKSMASLQVWAHHSVCCSCFFFCQQRCHDIPASWHIASCESLSLRSMHAYHRVVSITDRRMLNYALLPDWPLDTFRLPSPDRAPLGQLLGRAPAPAAQRALLQRRQLVLHIAALQRLKLALQVVAGAQLRSSVLVSAFSTSPPQPPLEDHARQRQYQ